MINARNFTYMDAQEIKRLRESLGLTQADLAKRIGVSLKTITNYETGGGIPASKQEILRLALSNNATPKHEATLIENPNIANIPLVSQYAYAGYMSGFTDDEYMKTLPTVPFIIDHELKGNYLSFEVKGDSMDDGSRDSLIEGDRLMCRQIMQHLWQYKLHINNWDFVIVHKTDGVLVKRIIAHDTERCEITIHSLNPLYEDRVLSLNDVAQLFNVIEVSRRSRR